MWTRQSRASEGGERRTHSNVRTVEFANGVSKCRVVESFTLGQRLRRPRLRGRGGKQSNQSGPFWVHPKEKDAAEFVEFLLGQVNVDAA